MNLTPSVANSAKCKNYSIENFRGIAIIFVMLSHVYGYPALGLIGDYLHFFVADATTWFIFISGFLFWHIECREKFDYIAFLKKS